jgi:quercetin dioxygenase-like cupin family protein
MPIGLAPNPRSSFAFHHIDDSALDKAEPMALPFNKDTFIRGYAAITQPNCQVIYEDFMPGEEFQWTFSHDEFQYCTSGEIEIEVFMPPLYAESVKGRLKAGAVSVFPVGARMHVKVIGDQPYRHICFCSPNPDYPFPTHESLV